MTKPRICFITPPSAFLLDERVFPNLGVLKVAACAIERGYPVEHLDLDGVENYEDTIAAHAATSTAQVYALTATTPQMPAIARIVSRLRVAAPKAKIVLGGPHPTLTAAAAKLEAKRGGQLDSGRAMRALEQLRQLVDVVVAGDGEDAIEPALRLERGLVDADDPKGILFLTRKRLEEVPAPARHLIDLQSYHYKIDDVPATSLVAQLGCPFGCAFSVAGDTIVFTDEGPIEIAELTRGIGVVRSCVHGPSMMEYRVDRMVATPEGRAISTVALNEGPREVLRVTVEGGLSIKATAEHRFMCAVDEKIEWRRAEELRPGDFMVIRRPDRDWPRELPRLVQPTLPITPPGGFPVREHHRMPEVLDEKLAWLAGFVIGDGSIPTDGRPSFHVCVTPGVEERLKEIIREVFNVELSVRPASNTTKMHHGWVHSRLAREVLIQSLGIDPQNKHVIPPIFWKAPKAVLQSFIDGLFAADSYTEPGGHTYLVTASEKLAKDVAYALLMLGHGCPSIFKVENGSGYGINPINYRVGVLDNDRIPTRLGIYKNHKSGLWHWRTRENRKGVRRRTLKESGLHHPLDRDGWHYAQVRSIENCLPETVYDISVPGEEAFVANGFAAHNCGGRASPMLRRARMRSTESIVAEIEHLYLTYGYKGYMMYDDELNVNPKLVELMRAIAALQVKHGIEGQFRLRGFVKSELFNPEQAEAMHAAGFRMLLCGFESGHPRILENIQKKATVEDNDRCVAIAHAAGIKVKALMSIGHAGESEETVEATKQWLLRVKPDDFDCTIITPYPGSPYYDEAVRGYQVSTPRRCGKLFDGLDGHHGCGRPEGHGPLFPDRADAAEPNGGHYRYAQGNGQDIHQVWTYTAPGTGDRLHAFELDYTKTADYYKGSPDGGYRSYVFTDHLSPEDLVRLRDDLERDVRAALGIQFNAAQAAVRYDHSMGQPGPLPANILRSSP